MLKIMVCSVHFGAGHTAHLSAYQKMLKECGFDVALYLSDQYMKLFHNMQGQVFFNLQDAVAFHPDIILIWNTGFENINVIKAFKKIHSLIVYVLHEPFMGITNLAKEKGYILKGTAAMLLNYWICMKSDKVILCSHYAEQNCKKYMCNAYKKSVLFPLIYSDEILKNYDRKYFSKIGGFGFAHGSEQFLAFVKNSYKRNNISFQIVTRANIDDRLKHPIFQKMIKMGRLIVQQGRSLTEEEMNHAYRISICTWNGYLRSTQSGVLANSFMQGTPVVATHLGSFDEYVKDGYNGAFIDNFTYESIFHAYQQIASNIDAISSNCRDTFLNNFYYKNQEARFKDIVKEIIG